MNNGAVALLMIRDSGTTPQDPLRVELDQSILKHTGLQAGDPITLLAEMNDAKPTDGSLIIRKAKLGEIAQIVPDLSATANEADSQGESHVVSMSIQCERGFFFEWSFPGPWVEKFFPGCYDPEYDETNSFATRYWSLSDLELHPGKAGLKLTSELVSAAATD
jgi:hypothetical protein